MSFIQRIAIVFGIFLAGCTASKTSTTATDTLTAPALQPYGRYMVNREQRIELISSAVHFGFSFEGKECKVYASLPDISSHNYLQYELDGVYQKRIRIEGSNTAPVVITAPTDGVHSVMMYKTTEAHSGPIVIYKVTGKNIRSLAPTKEPLIEFIGNSITCGAAADASETPCGTGVYHDQHNAYYAYGPRVSRMLHTNFILSSVSGIGIYRTWNMEGPSMPQVYEKTDFQINGMQNWDFKTYSPRIVSIALGTNDLSKGDGKHERPAFDSATFVTKYIEFVELVKSKYPNAQIALLSSPMVSGDARTLLQNCLTAVKENIDRKYPRDKQVATYFFNLMQPRGCSYHPSVEDHAILANELFPFFKKLLDDE